MLSIHYLYPNGKRRALTMSYDDCPPEDSRLVELFNRYHIKGTFHLISARVNRSNNWMTPSQLRELYTGHEISCHSMTHPFFDQISKEEILYELLEDKKNLEALCGYPVRGMSYPNGIVTNEVLEAMRAVGIVYGRTTVATNNYRLPQDFLHWNPTCHHSGNILEKIDHFRDCYEAQNAATLFYIWGHSFEFPRNAQNNSWSMIEEFCDRFTSTFEDSVWYATNIEIYDYLTALRSLTFSSDRTMVINHAAQSVWLNVNGSAIEIRPGLTKLPV